jgi:hypothetical protein
MTLAAHVDQLAFKGQAVDEMLQQVTQLDWPMKPPCRIHCDTGSMFSAKVFLETLKSKGSMSMLWIWQCIDVLQRRSGYGD